MTVVTKPTIDKKDEKGKALLSRIDKQPEVAVRVPQNAPTVASRRVPKKQSSSPCFTFLFFLVVVGIVMGVTYFSFAYYKRISRQRSKTNLGTGWLQSKLASAKPEPMQDFDEVEEDIPETRNDFNYGFAYVFIDRNELLISNTLEGGFYNLNGVKKTSKSLDRLTETDIEETEVTSEITTPTVSELFIETDIVEETLEMFQMPQLSGGKYIHDFKNEKTLIFDVYNDRCFITDLDLDEVSPPNTICDIIRGIEDGGGVYKLNLEEVRRETVAREVTVTRGEYGCPITTLCRGKKSYYLDELDEMNTMVKRSTEEGLAKKFDFVEFAGKSLIKYNIANINDL